MHNSIVNLEDVFAEAFFERAQSPHSLSLWVDRFRQVPYVASNLRVAAQIMNELCVCGAEQPFANRAETGLRRRTSLFRDLVAGQESFEIGALELKAAIDDEDLGH